MTASTMEHSALPELEEELEDEYEGEEFDLGGVISGLLGEAEGEYEDEYEDEYELEGEWEDEYEYESEGMANPLRRVYPDAMMEHLGHAAAEAETEAEAEAFIGALVPIAAGLVRSAAPHIARRVPQLVRGLSKVAHTLRRNPTTRPLVRALPTIASRTTRSLARQAAHGRPITSRRAVRTLARQTSAVLSSPHRRRQVIRRARVLDRHYHRAPWSGQWPAGAVRTPSAAAVRALAPQPVIYDGIEPVRYRVPAGGPAPVRYRYRVPTSGPAPVRYRVPAGGSAPVRRVRGRDYRSERRYPAGISIAWVPVPALCGGPPPRGAYRY